jgi:hypothetical protein
MCLLRDHDTTRDQKAIKWHRLDVIWDRPFRDQRNVALIANRLLCRQNRCVEILERLMTAITTAGPQVYNGETHIASGKVHDLTDPVHAPRFKGNVPDTLPVASVVKEAAENRIVVGRVKGNADTCGNLGLYLHNFGAE